MKKLQLPQVQPLTQAEILRLIRWLEQDLKIPDKDRYQTTRTF